MKLFDVGEKITKGCLVTTDAQTQEAFMTLGKDKEDPDFFEDFRFDTNLSVLMFAGVDLMSRGLLKKLRIHSGDVARDDDGFCLVRQRGEDRKALLRVGIAPGVGGKIKYTLSEGVDIIAEGVWGVNEGEDRYPMYVLVMLPGSFFLVERTGRDIDGPVKMLFVWDGTKLSREARR